MLFFTTLLALNVFAHPLATDHSYHKAPTQVTAAVQNEQESTRLPKNLILPPNPAPPSSDKAKTLGISVLLAQTTTNYRHASASQAKNIELIAERLNGTVVKSGQTFSYNRRLGPYTQANGYHWGRAFSGDRIVPSMGGGVCQGASTLYASLLRTGLPIVERHNHSLTVPYLPAGEDATVSMSSGLDFRFKNNQSHPVLITAKAYPDKRWLTIAVWSTEPVPKIVVKHKVFATYPFKTIQRRLPGSPAIVAPGQPGGKVSTWLEIHTQTGIVKKNIGTDVYRASPRIVNTATKS